MFEIIRYTSDKATEWNEFVAHSKNGTFIFNRGYMDYHSDRFEDYSLMFYRNGRLYALMPANRKGDVFQSHAGLTYGGLVMDSMTTAALTIELFGELNDYLRCQGFRSVMYRAIPWVYHRLPSEEDLYAMFWKCGARLLQRMSGSAVSMSAHIQWRKDHRRRLKQAHEAGVRVERDASLAEFWPVLNDNLQKKFQAHSVHTLE